MKPKNVNATDVYVVSGTLSEINNGSYQDPVIIVRSIAKACQSIPELPDARLGESVKQVEAHYGTPVLDYRPLAPAETGRTYMPKGGVTPAVTFWHGKSCFETYTKDDKSVFSEEELSGVLKTNANGSSWREQSHNDVAKIRMWKTADGNAIASLTDNQLVIMTNKFFAAGALF